MTSTRDLTRAFVDAASALAERIFAETQARDAELAAKVALSVQHGHRMRIAFTVGEAPIIVLSTVDDYTRERVIASIPLEGASATH